MSINRVSISGNVTRDPELKHTQGGQAILTFSVAVNDRKKNPQTGAWEDYPNFIDCTLWGSRAEAVAKFMAKGTKVAIDGKLHYSSWERDGQRRSKIEVYVDEIEFLSRQQGQQGAPRAQYAPQGAPQGQYYPNQAPMGYQEQQPQYSLKDDLYGNDIPF